MSIVKMGGNRSGGRIGPAKGHQGQQQDSLTEAPRAAPVGLQGPQVTVLPGLMGLRLAPRGCLPAAKTDCETGAVDFYREKHRGTFQAALRAINRRSKVPQSGM
jgi:hypothetical protein